MEYVCLIFQIILLLGIFIFKTNDRYLVNSNEFYKKYLIVELITQGICVVANVIILFLMKEIMIYILIMHIILMGIILIFYSNKAKKLYFDELLNIIVANDLQSIDSREIKKILLVKYEKVYFVEDIEKCKNHIKNI
ncbi:MAG: hypothetical protein IJE45_05810 [Bacilli bacterium]|nr:hypothetical protein [Bacilli bacterium]